MHDEVGAPQPGQSTANMALQAHGPPTLPQHQGVFRHIALCPHVFGQAEAVFRRVGRDGHRIIGRAGGGKATNQQCRECEVL